MRRCLPYQFVMNRALVVTVLVWLAAPVWTGSAVVAQEANQPAEIERTSTGDRPTTPEANRPRHTASEDQGQEVRDPATDHATPNQSADDAGLWPSPRLMRLMLTRMADDMVERYGLDGENRDKARDATVERWMNFLSENREQFQPLVNEFLEMRLSLEPPSQDQVKDFAERALPAFDATRSQIEQNWDDLREVMNPWQRAKFEIEALAARAGLEVAQRRLSQWKEGKFELTDVWEPRDRAAQREARQRRLAEQRERRERIEAEARAAEPSDQIELELDSWDQYAADFIRRYDLDEGQRDSVRSTLAEVKARARDHRDRYREDIVELERRIEAPDPSDDDREAIKEQLVRLYGPIDELFAELQKRLDAVPTELQRARVREAEQTKALPPADSNHP